MTEDIEITRSSGNVFADLGLADAGEKKVKVRLAVAINRAIKARSLTQTAAAKTLGTVQPKISELAHYRLSGFSIGKLMEYLTALDRDVELNITPARGHGRIVVHEAEPA